MRIGVTNQSEVPNMLNALFDQTAIPVVEQVVDFAQARHTTLASNLANLDTPGFRAADLSTAKFEARLKAAIERRHRREHANASSSTHRDPFADVRQPLNTILYHDESKKGVEHNVAEMAKNKIQHNTALAIMTSQFRLLQAAISERA